MPLYEKFIHAIGEMNFDEVQGKKLHQILLQKQMAALNAAQETLKKAIAAKEEAEVLRNIEGNNIRHTQNQEALRLQQEYIEKLQENLQKIQDDQKTVTAVATAAKLDITKSITIPQDFAQNFAQYFKNIKHVQLILEDAPPEIKNLQTDIIFEVLASVHDKKEQEQQIQELSAEEIKQILTSTIKKAKQTPEEAKKYRQLIQMLLFEVINREVQTLSKETSIDAKKYKEFFTNLNSKLPSREEIDPLTLLDDFSEYKNTASATPAQLLASVQEKVNPAERILTNQDFLAGAKAYRKCTGQLRFGQADRRAYAEKLKSHMPDSLFDARNRHENTIFTQNTSLGLYFLNLIASKKTAEKDKDLREKIHAHHRDLDADAIVKLKEVVTDVAVNNDIQKKYSEFKQWYEKHAKKLPSKYQTLPETFNTQTIEADIYKNYVSKLNKELLDIQHAFNTSPLPASNQKLKSLCEKVRQCMQEKNIKNQELSTLIEELLKTLPEKCDQKTKGAFINTLDTARNAFIHEIPSDLHPNKTATFGAENLSEIIHTKLSAEQPYDICLDKDGKVILTLNYFTEYYAASHNLEVEGDIIRKLAQNSEKLSDALTVKIYGDTLESIQQKISDPNNTTVLHEHMLKAIRKEYEVFDHIQQYFCATTEESKKELMQLITNEDSRFNMAQGAQGGYKQCYSQDACKLYSDFKSFVASRPQSKQKTPISRDQPTQDSLLKSLNPFITEQQLFDAALLMKINDTKMPCSAFNHRYLEIMRARIGRVNSYKEAMQEKMKTVAADLAKRFKEAIPHLELGENERLFYQLLQLYQLNSSTNTPSEVKLTFATLQEAFKAFDAGFNNTDASLTAQAIQDFANNLIDTELDTLCPENMSHDQYKQNLAQKKVNDLTYQEKDFLFNKRRKRVVHGVLGNKDLEANLKTAYTALATLKPEPHYSDAVKKGIETAQKLVGSAAVRVTKTQELFVALAQKEDAAAIKAVAEIYKTECKDMQEELQLTPKQKTELNEKIDAMVSDNITLMRRIERGEPVLQPKEVDAYFDAIATIAQALQAQKPPLTMENVRFKITHGQTEVKIFDIAGKEITTKNITSLPYSLYKAPGQSDFHFSFGGTRGINASFGALDEAYGQRRRLFTNMRLLGVGQYGAVKEVENLITGINQILKKGVTGKEVDAFKEAARQDPRFRAITARTDPLFDVESPLLRALSDATTDSTSKTASWTEIETKTRNTAGPLFQSEHPEAYYILTSLAKGETYADTARKVFSTSSKGDAAYHNPLARKESQQSVGDLISLSRSIVEKSQYYQKLGFTHNDIKPENFLYLRKDDGTYEVKFIDWATGGFSQEYKGATREGEKSDDALKRIFKEKFGVDWPTIGLQQEGMISDAKGRFVLYDSKTKSYAFGINPTLQITYGAHNCTLPYICPQLVAKNNGTPTILDANATTMDDWALTAMIFGICNKDAYFKLATGRVVSDYTVPGAIEPDGQGGLKATDGFDKLFACGTDGKVMFIPGNSREGEPLHLYRRLDAISKKLNQTPEQQELKTKIEKILTTAHDAIEQGIGLSKEKLLGNEQEKGLLAEAEDCVKQYEKLDQKQSTLANANLLASVLASIDDTKPQLQNLDDKINISSTSQGLPAELRSIAPHTGGAAAGPAAPQHEVSKLEVLCTSPATPEQQKQVAKILEKLVTTGEFNNRFKLDGNHPDLLQKCIALGRADVLKTLLSKVTASAKESFIELVTAQGLIHYALQQGMTETATQIITALKNAGATTEEIYALITKTYGPKDNQPHIKWSTDAFDIAIRNGNLDQLNLLLAQIPENLLTPSAMTGSSDSLDKALHTAAVYTNTAAFDAILAKHPMSAAEILKLRYPPENLSPYHLFLKNERTLDAANIDGILNANKAQEFLLGRADTPTDQDTPGISSTTSSASTSPIDSASSPTTPTASASSTPPTSRGLSAGSRNSASSPLLIAAKNGNSKGVKKLLELADKANLTPTQWQQFLTQTDLDGKNILNHLLEHNDVALFTEVLNKINTDRRLGLGPTTTADMLGLGPTYDVAQQASATLTTLLSNPDPVNPLNNFLQHGLKEKQLDVLTQALNALSINYGQSSPAQQENRAAIILHNKAWFYEQAKDEKNHAELRGLLTSDALGIVPKRALLQSLVTGLQQTAEATRPLSTSTSSTSHGLSAGSSDFFQKLLNSTTTPTEEQKKQITLTIPLIDAKVSGLQGSDQSATIIKLHEEIEQLKASIVKLGVSNATLESELAKLKAEHDAQIKKASDLNTELATAKENLQSLQSSSVAKKEELQQQIQTISSQLEQTKMATEDTKAQIAAKFEEYKKSSEEKLSKLTAETQKKIDTLTQEFSLKSATEQEQSRAALATAKADLEKNLETEKSEYATKLDALTKEHKTATEKLSDELKTLQAAAKTNEQETKKLQAEIQGLQKRNTGQDEVNSKQLEEFSAQKAEFDEKQEKFTAQLANLQQQLVTAGTEKEILSKQFAAQQTEQTALTQKQTESTANLAALTKKTEEEQAAHKTALEAKQKELTATKKENESLQQQLNTLQETGGKKDTETQAQIEQLKANLNTQKQTIGTTQSELEKSKAALDEKTQEFTATLQRLNTTNEKLAKTLHTQKEKLAQFMASARVTHTRQSAFSKWKGWAAKKTQEKAQKQIQEQDLRIDQQLASISTQGETIRELQNKLDTSKTQATASELRTAELDEKLKTQTENQQKLQQKIILQKQTAITELRSQIEALQKSHPAATQATSAAGQDKTTADPNALHTQKDILIKLNLLLQHTQELQQLQQALELTAPLTNVRGSVDRGSDSIHAQPTHAQPTSAQPSHDQPSRDRQEAEQLKEEIAKLTTSVTQTEAAIQQKAEQLQQQLTDKTKAASTSASQVTVLTTKLQQQETTQQQLQTQLDAQQQAVQKAEAATAAQKTDFEKKTAELKQTHDAAQADLKKKIEAVTTELSELKVTNANQTTQLQSQKATNASQATALQQQRDTNATQVGELTSQTSKITALEKSLTALQEAQAKQETEFTKQSKQLETTSKTAIEDAQTKLKEAQTTFTTAETALKQQLEVNTKVITTLQTELAEQKANTGEVQKAKTELESQITALQNDNAVLTAAQTKLQTELNKQKAAHTAECDAHQKKLEEKTTKANAIQAQNRQLQGTLGSTQRENSALTAKVDKQTKAAADLGAQIEQLTTEHAAALKVLSDKVGTTKEEKDELSVQYQKKLDELTAQLAAVRSELDGTQKTITENKQRINELQTNNTTLEQSLQNTKGSNARLQQLIKEATANGFVLKKEQAKLTIEIRTLTEDATTKDAEHKAALQTQKDKFDEQVTGLRKTTASQHTRLNKVTDENNKLKTEAREHKQQLATQQATLAEQAQKLTDAQTTLSTQQTENKSLVASNAQLQAENAAQKTTLEISAVLNNISALIDHAELAERKAHDDGTIQSRIAALIASEMALKQLGEKLTVLENVINHSVKEFPQIIHDHYKRLSSRHAHIHYIVDAEKIKISQFIKNLQADLTTQDTKATAAYERNKKSGQKHDLASITDDIVRYKANADILEKLKSLSGLKNDERTAMRGVLNENEKAFVENKRIKKLVEKLSARLIALDKNISKNAKSAEQSCESALKAAEVAAVKAGDDFSKDKAVKNQQQDLDAAKEVLEKLQNLLALKQELQQALAEFPDKSPLPDGRGSVGRGSDNTRAQPTHAQPNRGLPNRGLPSHDRQGVEQLKAKIIEQEKIVQQKQEALSTTTQKLEAEKNKLTLANREMEIEVKGLRNSVNDRSGIIQHVRDLEGKDKQQQNQIKTLQDENAAFQTEVTDAKRTVEESLQASETASNAANERNADLQAQFDIAQSNLQEACAKIEEVEGTNAILSASVVQATAQSAQLQTNLKSVITENQELVNHNQSLEEQTINLQQQVADLQQRMIALQNSEHQAKTNAAEFNADLQTVTEDKQALQQQLQDLRLKLVTLTAELKQTTHLQRRPTEESRRDTEELIQPHNTTARPQTAEIATQTQHMQKEDPRNGTEESTLPLLPEATSDAGTQTTETSTITTMTEPLINDTTQQQAQPPAPQATTAAQTTQSQTPLSYATKARHVAIFKEFAGEMLASVSLVPPLGPLAALAVAADANAGLTAAQGLYTDFRAALNFKEDFLHNRLIDRWGEMVSSINIDDTYFAEIQKEAKKLCDAKTSLENRINTEADIDTLIKIASTYNDDALAAALETSASTPPYKKESFYDLPQKLLLDKRGRTYRVTRSEYVRNLADAKLQLLFDASRNKNEQGLTPANVGTGPTQVPVFDIARMQELAKENKNLFKKMQDVRDKLYQKDGPLGLSGETFKDKVERLINDRYFALSPEFQASARHHAQYFEEKLKALTKDGEDIISVLEKQRAQIWEQLDSLPSERALNQPAVDAAVKAAVNEQRARLEAEIDKIDDAMKPLERLMERMHGDGDEKHRPDWRYGLLETMQHAKSNYSAMRVDAGSLQVSYKDMSLEDLKTELQSKPNATDITATGNAAVGGSSSKYGLAVPIEAGKVRVYEIGEMPPPPASGVVGAPPQTPVVHGRFMESYTTEQSPQLKVLKFPQGNTDADHENKVKIALAMATQLLAGLKYIPSKKTPIRVENGTSDELKYILAALYALGKTSKTFDETCIQVTSGAKGFDKKDEWKSTIGIGKFFDTGLGADFMKLNTVKALADDTKAVFTAKFFSNYKRDKKWRGADDFSQNRGVGEREHDLSGIGKITEKFKGKLQEINPEHDAAEAAKHLRNK